MQLSKPHIPSFDLNSVDWIKDGIGLRAFVEDYDMTEEKVLAFDFEFHDSQSYDGETV